MYYAVGMTFPTTTQLELVSRRAEVFGSLHTPAVVFAGSPVARNYPGNTYPFRASSHFLYLAGQGLADSALLWEGGKVTLFTPQPTQDDALWHGATRTLDALRDELRVDSVRPRQDLAFVVSRLGSSVATLPVQDAATKEWARAAVGREFSHAHDADAQLCATMISTRLNHDESAKQQLRAAAQASAAAHVEGMRKTRGAATEAEVCAAITASLYRRDMRDAYGPIVTVRGEVLHQHAHDGVLSPGDLLLCDVGGETPEGWAADITRTWPVTGTFSPTQRIVYDLVLGVQRACVDMVRPGTSYRAIHQAAKRFLVDGLVSIGIFRGTVDGLLERGAAALFFPHGVGHLLGLDVHDMEDLGDHAGYEPGRTRSESFGDCFLRLDRTLTPGMAVTIEPGFYQVPAILQDAKLTSPFATDLNRDVLARFSDVRGIRIEDDVLCTEAGPEVLSLDCPKDAQEIERIIRG